MTQSKIVILEADQHRRDYIRSIVSDRGYLPYIFEKETICLDNLLPLDPDLVISGPLPHERVCRFVNTVKMKNGNLPVLIISGDHSVRDSARSNGFTDVGDSVFAGDISWLASVGVTAGCNPPANDRFCPDRAVTRGQMAAFLRRALTD